VNGTAKNFICIRCPRGCEIATSLDGQGSIMEISGNVCKLGEDYVKNELTDPRRILTTTVRVKNGNHPLVPVWTEKPIPKDKIFDLASELRKKTLQAPMKAGQIVLENVFGLGINIITSGSVKLKT
jgi:CxxC motif-containing protein